MTARATSSRRRVSAEDAARSLAFCDFVQLVRRPTLMEDEPDLPDRIRGALGRRLEDLAAGNTDSAQDAGTLWRLLFGPSGASDARPYVLRVTFEGPAIRVVLRLFGSARNLWQPATTALAAALAGGIALKQGGRQRVAMQSIGTATVACTGLPAIPTPQRATLMFRTPVLVRSGRHAKTSLGSLPTILAMRTDALLAWQGLRLEMDRGTLAAAQESLLQDARGLAWLPQIRHSSSTGSQGILLGGLVGPLRLQGDLTPIWPLLCIGAITHVGSGTAFGLGRYDLLAGV